MLDVVDGLATIPAVDLAGHLPLPLGVLGHEGSTVIVGLNGLRLLRAGAWRKAIAGRNPRGSSMNPCPRQAFPLPR